MLELSMGGRKKNIIRLREKTKHLLHLICKIFVVTSKILGTHVR